MCWRGVPICPLTHGGFPPLVRYNRCSALAGLALDCIILFHDGLLTHKRRRSHIGAGRNVWTLHGFIYLHGREFRLGRRWRPVQLGHG